MTATQTQKIEQALSLSIKKLMQAAEPEGFWQGHLASSSVSTSVALMALAKTGQHSARVEKAAFWLAENINSDGGWGDTTDSPSNVTAVLLTRAALIYSNLNNPLVEHALLKSEHWLNNRLKSHNSEELINHILDFYGKDLTFSAPILTVCLLCGAIEPCFKNWKKVPALPFEISVLPDRLFSFMKLPVVSYAIPALIAVGIVQYKKSPPKNKLLKNLRKKTIRPALNKLTKLIPESGGFLEAAPLTGFVAFCLTCAGHGNHLAAKMGIEFLINTVRSDGSWPIDTNLSTWLTSLSVKALAQSDSMSHEHKQRLITYYRQTQQKQIHPFTNAMPGGWSWTNLTGGVPDADDTAGALVALHYLLEGEADSSIIAGINWLLGLMNKDGGIPTFCRGWGFLPFDRSCPDLSAHAITAFRLWKSSLPEKLRQKCEKAISRLINYLEDNLKNDKWFPLWFGDQDSPDQTSPAYGTAVVLESLACIDSEQARQLCKSAADWLLRIQNPDGGWGGSAGCSSKIEITARVVSALAQLEPENETTLKGALYLSKKTLDAEGIPAPAPIGMYFSSLWYHEKLYPLIFTTHALSITTSRQKELSNATV